MNVFNSETLKLCKGKITREKTKNKAVQRNRLATHKFIQMTQTRESRGGMK